MYPSILSSINTHTVYLHKNGVSDMIYIYIYMSDMLPDMFIDAEMERVREEKRREEKRRENKRRRKKIKKEKVSEERRSRCAKR